MSSISLTQNQAEMPCMAALTLHASFLTINAMKVLPVLCQGCGAPLRVEDPSVRFVTCSHCSSTLEIVREATQSHTRIIERIYAATQDHSQRLEVIELQNDIQSLDQNWIKQQRESGNIEAKTGQVGDGDSTGCFLLGVLLLGAALVSALSIFEDGSFSIGYLACALFCAAFGAFGIREGILSMTRFHRHERQYLSIRASMIERIRNLRRKRQK
jgi:hypothetical protein